MNFVQNNKTKLQKTYSLKIFPFLFNFIISLNNSKISCYRPIKIFYLTFPQK